MTNRIHTTCITLVLASVGVEAGATPSAALKKTVVLGGTTVQALTILPEEILPQKLTRSFPLKLTRKYPITTLACITGGTLMFLQHIKSPTNSDNESDECNPNNNNSDDNSTDAPPNMTPPESNMNQEGNTTDNNMPCSTILALPQRLLESDTAYTYLNDIRNWFDNNKHAQNIANIPQQAKDQAIQLVDRIQNECGVSEKDKAELQIKLFEAFLKASGSPHVHDARAEEEIRRYERRGSTIVDTSGSMLELAYIFSGSNDILMRMFYNKELLRAYLRKLET